MASNDPYFPSTVLALHFDGANGGTAFTDSSIYAKAITVSNATTSTSQKKYGTASGYFNGTSGYASTTTGSEFNFGTGDFTVEAWIYVDSTGSGPREIFNKFTTWSTNLDFVFEISSAGKLWFGAGDSLGINLTSDSAVPTNTWVHVAAARASGTTKIFVGGVQQAATHSGSVTIPNDKTTLFIGEASSGGNYFKGYIDDARITKGVARYTATFTPPTTEFPNYGYYLSGAISEATAITDWQVRVYRMDTGALLTSNTCAGSTYEVSISEYSGLVMAACHAKIDNRWAGGTAYTSGYYVAPTDPETTPYVFKCTTGGTSHATTEPTWPTSSESTVSDGTVTWTCQDRIVQPILHGPVTPSI